MDFLLDKETKLTEDYQLIFLTHDKNLYHFVTSKIKQLDSPANWIFKEMYVGKQNNNIKEFPVIIDSDLGNLEKANKYFNAKDYTSCALYIRKELEKLIIDRLPPEYTKVIENQYHNLVHLWKLCVERYQKLGFELDADLKNSFDQTKLMLLNPQAHHNLSFPVYTLELEKAFQLIQDIEVKCPIPCAKILVSKGMILIFKHPVENYSLRLQLISDFYIDGLLGNSSTILPRCEILSWQYNDVEFWDFKTDAVIVLKKPIQHNLKQIKDTITDANHVPLNVTEEIFKNHTVIENSIWSLNEIIDKSGVSLD